MKTKIGIYLLLLAFTGVLFLVMKDIMASPSNNTREVKLLYSYNNNQHHSVKNNIESRSEPVWNQNKHTRKRGFTTRPSGSEEIFKPFISLKKNYKSGTSYKLSYHTATTPNMGNTGKRTTRDELTPNITQTPALAYINISDVPMTGNNNQMETLLAANTEENENASENMYKSAASTNDGPSPEGEPLGEGIVLFLVLSLLYITYQKIKATRLQ